jgi:hypothetical protein
MAAPRHRMGMRHTRLLGIAALAVIAAAIGGCSDPGTQPDGAWTGCGNVARPAVVQVNRTVALARPRVRPLSVTQRRAKLVRRLYYDLCVIVGHPDHPPLGSAISCPADFGLVYAGVFYAGDRKLAAFSYAASGCQGVWLSAGSDQASTMIYGKAAAAEPASFTADLAAVLGVRPALVYQPSSLPGPSR